MNTPEQIKTPRDKEGFSYLLKSVASDMTAHGGFKWPESGEVASETWNPEPECGNGLHGMLWGSGDFSLAVPKDPTRRWIIFRAPADSVVAIDLRKAKTPKAEVTFCGRIGDAIIRMATLRLTIVGNSAPASTTGDYAPASTTGYSAPASTTGNSAPASTTGNYAPASTTGNSAPASTTGNSAPASTTGDSAPASTTGNSAPASTTGYSAPASTTGYSAPASTTGDYAPASTTGYSAPASALMSGIAKAGENGTLVLGKWDESKKRFTVVVGYIGENDLKPHTWYRLNKAFEIESVPAGEFPNQ